MTSDEVENNAVGSTKVVVLEEGFWLAFCKNDTSVPQRFKKTIPLDMIQFHFCAKGSVEFIFNEGRYSLRLEDDRNLLLYNPDKKLPVNVIINEESWMVSLLISLEHFHGLFSEDTSYIDFLKDGKQGKKYYRERAISPATAVTLSQILNLSMPSSAQKVYLKGKAYELLGLYFNRTEAVNIEQCPFLEDEGVVKKIKDAKDIMIENLTDPPTLHVLSEEIGLSLKKLKKGFKEVYGETVYGFLFEYKMEYARKLLETGQYNVNEVGLKIGYSTASHFISGFKKKFGTTPKKYMTVLKS